jgi:hypothetical protein
LRKFVLLAAGFAVAVSAPATAAWQGYKNERLGYAVVFPTAPTEAVGNYKSDLIPGAPTAYATARDGDGTFVALVVETGRPEDGTIIMGEFEYFLSHFGDVVVNTTLRLNVGMEYGRFLTIDCRDGVASDGPLQVERAKRMFQDAAKLSCPNGARLAANLFFTQGRLYLIAAIQAGPDAKASGAPVRFTNSLEWIGGNAEHGRALIARSSLAGRAAAPAAPPPAAAAPPAAGNR